MNKITFKHCSAASTNSGFIKVKKKKNRNEIAPLKTRECFAQLNNYNRLFERFNERNRVRLSETVLIRNTLGRVGNDGKENIGLRKKKKNKPYDSN